VIRPVRSEADYDAALTEIERYFDNPPKPGTSAADRFDLLALVIEDYERKNCAKLPEVTPLAMLKHLMDEHEMNVSDLGRVIGSQSNASLILSGKRAISKRVMRLLSQHFGVEPTVFL